MAPPSFLHVRFFVAFLSGCLLAFLQTGRAVPSGDRRQSNAWNSNSNNWQRDRAAPSEPAGHAWGDAAGWRDAWSSWSTSASSSSQYTGNPQHGWDAWYSSDASWTASVAHYGGERSWGHPSQTALHDVSGWQSWSNWGEWSWEPDPAERRGEVSGSARDVHRPRGFYRHGVLVDRQRNDEEQRFHTGGQGQQRQGRRQERMRQWREGTFVPAWRRDMEATGARLEAHVARGDLGRGDFAAVRDAEARADEALRRAAGPATTVAADAVSEDHTSCSLSTASSWDWEDRGDAAPDATTDGAEDALEASLPSRVTHGSVSRDRHGVPAEAAAAHSGLTGGPRGDLLQTGASPLVDQEQSPGNAPRQSDGPVPALASPSSSRSDLGASPVGGGDASRHDPSLQKASLSETEGSPATAAPAPPRWTLQQWNDWEAWEDGEREQDASDQVNLMQLPDHGPDTTPEGPAGGADTTPQGPAGGDAHRAGDEPSAASSSTSAEAHLGVAPARSLTLSVAEQQALLDAGWPMHGVVNLRDFCDFLDWAHGEFGSGAVAWAMDAWGDALVMANATVELAQEYLWERLRDAPVQRPLEEGVRGRLTIGFAGLQRQLDDMHMAMVQEGLRRQWIPPNRDPDGRQLPEPPFIRGDHGAWAMSHARSLARTLVSQAQARGVVQRQEALEGRGSAPARRLDGTREEGSGDEAMENETEDAGAFMQLTVDEEARLHNNNVQDEARRHLRSLLLALSRMQDRGEGPEYRWGVRLVVESWDAALQAVQVVRDALARRTTNMGALPYYPATREPAVGPLRSRVVAYMAEFRHLLQQALEEEVALQLVERSRSSAASIRAAAHHRGVPSGRGGRNTRQRHVPGRDVARRSRSRSLARGDGALHRDVPPAPHEPDPLPPALHEPDRPAPVLREPEGLLPPGVDSAAWLGEVLEQSRATVAEVLAGPPVTDASGVGSPALRADSPSAHRAGCTASSSALRAVPPGAGPPGDAVVPGRVSFDPPLASNLAVVPRGEDMLHAAMQSGAPDFAATPALPARPVPVPLQVPPGRALLGDDLVSPLAGHDALLPGSSTTSGGDATGFVLGLSTPEFNAEPATVAADGSLSEVVVLAVPPDRPVAVDVSVVASSNLGAGAEVGRELGAEVGRELADSASSSSS